MVSSPANPTRKVPWNKITNEQDPLRIAVLGGNQVGKSSFITKLQSGIFQETYYPTSDFTTTLLKFKPILKKSRLILDELANSSSLNYLINEANNIVLSSNLAHAFAKNDAFDVSLTHERLNELNYNNEKLAKLVNKLKLSPSAPDLQIQSDLYAYYYANFQDTDDYTYNSPIDDYYKPLLITNSSTTIKNSNALLSAVPTNVSTNSFKTAISGFSSSSSSSLNAVQSHASRISNHYQVANPNGNSYLSPRPYHHQQNNNSNSNEKNLQFQIPLISPILIEMVDTPTFNPSLIVPFLELSLGARIGEEYLHNLANDPRLPIATRPMLVGSGAGELNGSIDGYVLMYSAVPNLNPPAYQEIASALPNNANSSYSHLPSSSSASSSSSGPSSSSSLSLSASLIENNLTQGQRSGSPLPDHSSFELLHKMRSVIFEGWKSYKLYLKQYQTRSETDAFSITSSIKHLWKVNKQQQKDRKLEKEKEASANASSNSSSPSNLNNPSNLGHGSVSEPIVDEEPVSSNQNSQSQSQSQSQPQQQHKSSRPSLFGKSSSTSTSSAKNSSSKSKHSKHRKHHRSQQDDLDLSIPRKDLEFKIDIKDDEVPSIIIICTHVKDFRASPVLIANGKELAKLWNCCFISMDTEPGFAVEEGLALLVREIVERRKAKRR